VKAMLWGLEGSLKEEERGINTAVSENKSTIMRIKEDRIN